MRRQPHRHFFVQLSNLLIYCKKERIISMKVLHKILGGINLTWLKVIILAVITGIYTGLINQVPFLFDTSFRDIAISYEVWIFFGVFIIMNSKSNLDSGLKCFAFFLISQPFRVYLSNESFGILNVDVNTGEIKEKKFYLLHALLKKAGKTDVIIESPSGEKVIYEIDIRRNDFDLVKK